MILEEKKEGRRERKKGALKQDIKQAHSSVCNNNSIFDLVPVIHSKDQSTKRERRRTETKPDQRRPERREGGKKRNRFFGYS